MKVLIVGKGGREHALAWKIARSPLVSEIHAAPGSPGMAALAACLPGIRVDTPSSDMERLRSEILRLRDFASEQRIDLTVVGPDDALAGGLVDEFTAAGLPVFGPTAAAARIETDKRFSKELMARIGVPTAAHRTFSDSGEAIAYVEERGTPIVVKATGLAAGKGVAVCRRQEEAVAAVRERMVDRQFGDAGSEVVIEDFMEGEEASLFAVTDGEEFVSLVPAQDHKPIFDGDRGPNTGGMGAYAPAPVMTAGMTARVEAEIVAPVLREMARLGCPFRGVLYVGLMIVEGRPKVVEFNCRFGDPEAQVVLPLLESDLVELLLASARGDIGRVRGSVRTARRGRGLRRARLRGLPGILRDREGDLRPRPVRRPGGRGRLPRRHRAGRRQAADRGRTGSRRHCGRSRSGGRRRQGVRGGRRRFLRGQVLPPRHRPPGARPVVTEKPKKRASRDDRSAGDLTIPAGEVPFDIRLFGLPNI